MTLVHDDGYLIHGTKMDGGDGTKVWIVEVTDATDGSMIDQEQYQVEDRSEIDAILARYREKYPE